MTLRKRRDPTPTFRLPTPFQPMTGEFASLQTEGVFPYCVQMQVAASDDQDEYVLCRGFDPRINKFVDYEEDNENKPGIPVAKPYGMRAKNVYAKWSIYAAALPIQGSPFNVPSSPTAAPIRLGQNPGKASSSDGQPAAGDEEVEALLTTDGKAVNWLFLQGPELIWCITLDNHPGTGETFDVMPGQPSIGDGEYDFDCSGDALTGIDFNYTESEGGTIPEPNAGAQGWFRLVSFDGTMYAQVVSLDCDTRGACS